jgi:hypothetical protein
MKNRHFESCGVAICAASTNPDDKNESPWYPGEKICCKKPFQKFQKVQTMINREVEKGTFRNITTPYTANELENKSI